MVGTLAPFASSSVHQCIGQDLLSPIFWMHLLLEWCTLAGFENPNQIFLSRVSHRACQQRKHHTYGHAHISVLMKHSSPLIVRASGKCLAVPLPMHVPNVSLCRIAGWNPLSSSSQLYHRDVPDRGIVSSRFLTHTNLTPPSHSSPRLTFDV